MRENKEREYKYFQYFEVSYVFPMKFMMKKLTIPMIDRKA